MPFGALNLKEKFIAGDPPQAREMAALGGFVQNRSWPRVDYLAVAGGAAVALAAMEAGSYDLALINNRVLDGGRLRAALARLSGLNHEQRARLPGLEAGRADIIIPGLLILRAIMSALSLHQATVVTAGLVEGIMTAFVQKNEEIFNYDPGRDRFDF
jgi:exopolyphosphatase/guanosine-5'-triphosphate,3'-diphosphate pyrophosphatase